MNGGVFFSLEPTTGWASSLTRNAPPVTTVCNILIGLSLLQVLQGPARSLLVLPSLGLSYSLASTQRAYDGET